MFTGCTPTSAAWVSPTEMKKTTQKITMGISLGLWLLAPLAAMVFFFQAGSQQQIAERAETWVPVGTGGAVGSTSVDLSLSWSLPSTPVAPAWQGIVQKTYLTAGTPITDGRTIVRIAGIDRLGYASSIPFGRVLTQGDQGEDVTELNRLLGHLKYPHGAGNEYGTLTGQGVLQLAEKIGAPKTGAFDPAWIIFLASKDMVADQIRFVVGAPAPAAGTVIIQPRSKLTRAVLLAPGTAPPTPDAALGSTGGPDPAAPAPANAPTVQKFTAPGGTTFRVGKQELSLNDAREEVAPKDLPLLEAQLATGAAITTGRLDRPSSPDEVTVPAAAIIMGNSGATCVRKSSDGGQSGSVISVDITGDNGGKATITGDIKAGDRVQVSAKSEDRQCG